MNNLLKKDLKVSYIGYITIAKQKKGEITFSSEKIIKTVDKINPKKYAPPSPKKISGLGKLKKHSQ